MITPKIEYTEDGSHTLRHPVVGDSYHSLKGAVSESMHVFIRNGLEVVSEGKKEISIFEMGFGTGLNAWLTLEYARANDLKTDYHAVDKYPIDISIAEALNYTSDPLFLALHKAAWNSRTEICDSFTLTKQEADLADLTFGAIFDIIYYDAFSPESQPELWTPEIFRRFFNSLSDGGILVTYSAKGSVKEALRSAGFTVKRREGALGKRHMVVAGK